LAAALGLTACAEKFEHDSAAAARNAETFVEVAFARNDGERGYALLAPATRRYVSLEQFKRTLSRLHPQALPKPLRASEYELMKGEKAIYIYLSGENSGEQFNYRITMVGTADSGYQVLKFERSNEPYGPSPGKHKLPAR